MSEDRLYTVGNDTLYVYSMSDLTSPIATYKAPSFCGSALIADNRLFLGGNSIQIIVYEISTSLPEPLKELATIETFDVISKMMKFGQALVLGFFDFDEGGYLQIYDLENFKITHTQEIKEVSYIRDMIAIEDSENLLLAGSGGVVKATKDQAIKHYFHGKQAQTLCHIA